MSTNESESKSITNLIEAALLNRKLSNFFLIIEVICDIASYITLFICAMSLGECPNTLSRNILAASLGCIITSAVVSFCKTYSDVYFKKSNKDICIVTLKKAFYRLEGGRIVYNRAGIANLSLMDQIYILENIHSSINQSSMP